MTADPRASYASAGVSIEAGDAVVDAIGPLVRATARPGAVPSLGGFGGLFDLAAAGHQGSLLVAATDGVGTKLRLALDLDRHDTVGIDLVAMCVNDVLAQGAEPLFFLDYYAAGRLEPAIATRVVGGIAKGCSEAGCALIGGETAEMPGHYTGRDYDLAGFVVGAVPPDRLLPRPTITPGDALLALPSSGAHSNGFSLIRKVVAERGVDLQNPFEGGTLADTLMAPTRIYVRSVLAAFQAAPGAIGGIAHITGGGLTGNVPRMLPKACAAEIERARLPRHLLMAWLQREGRFDDATMEATFNCGVGLVMAVEAGALETVAATLTAHGEAPVVIGSVVTRGADEPACRIR